MKDTLPGSPDSVEVSRLKQWRRTRAFGLTNREATTAATTVTGLVPLNGGYAIKGGARPRGVDRRGAKTLVHLLPGRGSRGAKEQAGRRPLGPLVLLKTGRAAFRAADRRVGARVELGSGRARRADAPKRGEQTSAVLRYARLLVEETQQSGRGRVAWIGSWPDGQ